MDQHDLTALAAQAERAVGRETVERAVDPLLRHMQRRAARMAERQPGVDDARHALLPPGAERLDQRDRPRPRSEEHTSEPQSLMRTPYAVYCLKKNTPRTP